MDIASSFSIWSWSDLAWLGVFFSWGVSIYGLVRMWKFPHAGLGYILWILGIALSGGAYTFNWGPSSKSFWWFLSAHILTGIFLIYVRKKRDKTPDITEGHPNKVVVKRRTRFYKH